MNFFINSTLIKPLTPIFVTLGSFHPSIRTGAHTVASRSRICSGENSRAGRFEVYNGEFNTGGWFCQWGWGGCNRSVTLRGCGGGGPTYYICSVAILVMRAAVPEMRADDIRPYGCGGIGRECSIGPFVGRDDLGPPSIGTRRSAAERRAESSRPTDASPILHRYPVECARF